MKRLLLHAVIAASICLPIMVVESSAADSRSTFRLQSTGERWGSGRAWPRFSAGQRSFRFKGVSGNSICSFKGTSARVFSSPQANRGSSLRANLPASRRTVRRSYGATARYSTRQRIITYRRHHSSGQANRGATIGRRGR